MPHVTMDYVALSKLENGHVALSNLGVNTHTVGIEVSLSACGVSLEMFAQS